MLSTPSSSDQAQAVSLFKVRKTFRRWLHLPDIGPLEIVLGAYAGNRLPGDPCWVLLVGGSSSGKTEIVVPLLSLPKVHAAATISEANLLSGTARGQRVKGATGGLLKTIGDFGILLMKDFTSVLTQNRDTRAKALSALRECYDGSWNRPLGIDGGGKISWKGKLGIIGGVTGAIDSEHQVMSLLGPRFMLFRMPAMDADLQAEKALNSTHQEEAMRAELAEVIRRFFDGIDFNAVPPTLSIDEENYLKALAGLVVRARSAVERNSFTREIEAIPDAELPGRLIRSLKQLWCGLKLVGVDPARQFELIRKVGFDCIPPLRRLAFDFIASAHPNRVTATDMTKAGDYPRTVIDRALQDLRCHKVLDASMVTDQTGSKTLWGIAEPWTERCRLLGVFPNCTGQAKELAGAVEGFPEKYQVSSNSRDGIFREKGVRR